MLQAVFGGLTNGATYALLGLGIVLVYNVARVVNMAQGEFYALGAFIAISLVAIGLPVWAAALIACAATTALGGLSTHWFSLGSCGHRMQRNFWAASV